MDSRDPDSSEALLLDTLTQDTNSEDLGGHETTTPDVPPATARRLFISHFLSTWNTRAFEFGAVLYLASIFSRTLQPMSVYALARGASAIVFSPAVGRYIDTSDRLQVARLSIVLQRLVVTVSCVGFWFLATGWPLGHGASIGLLAFLTVLACVEKLCSIMNLVSVEKDWVAVIAGNNEPTLRALNSQMRRIDLICKLAGPLFIAFINGISMEVAILVNLAMNIVSVLVEYYAIEKVYKMVPELQISKRTPHNETPQSTMAMTNGFLNNWQHLKDGMRTNLKDLSRYLHHRAFLPSFTCALLYFTVLSFGSQMITYLLFVGYNSIHIGIARTLSVAFEISATCISPLAMARIGPIRSGIWFISWQMLCLAGAIIVFWVVETPVVSAFGLIAGTILSRVGLWGFDLSVQIIVQQEVEPDYRGSFSSLEASWQNTFELCSYATTIIFSRPDQFQWPALMSCTAVFTAGGLYMVFVRSRRGHLVHLSRFLDLKEWKRRLLALGYERLSGFSVA